MATIQEVQACAEEQRVYRIKYRARCQADFYTRLQEALHSRAFLDNGQVYRKMVVFEDDVRTITTPSLIIKLESHPIDLGSLTVTAKTGTTK